MRRYGNAGNVSSLISSARSAYEKSQSLQDQIEGYNWELSAKTAEDAQKYIDYLGKRAKSYEGIDQSKQITLQQKANSANRSFVSAETGRLSNQVLEGNISNTQKYAQLKSLYQQAVDNGDDNLAQRLYGNLDRLSMTIQNEQIAAANAASSGAGKAYTALKKGIDQEISNNKSALTLLERALKTGEIDRTQYLTKKKMLLGAREEVIKQSIGINADGTISNPHGLKEEDVQKYGDMIGALKDSNPNFYGKKGELLDKGLSPFNVVQDPNSDTAKLVDRQVAGYSWLGGLAAPEYVDKTDAKKAVKEFEKLGFAGGKWTKDGYEVQLPDGSTIYAQIKDVGGQKIAIYKDPRTGTLGQVTPEGKTALLMSSERNGGSDYYSPLMDQQKQAAQAESDKGLGGLAGVARAANDSKLIEATPMGSFAASGMKIKDGKGGLGDWANVALGGLPGTNARIWGDTLSKLGQITGLQKRVDEKKKAEAAAWAQQQAEIAQAQQASNNARQAQAAQAAAQNKGVSPGTLRYDFTTGKVINGGYGAPAIPADVVKSSRTPGTTDFAKKYLLPRGY